MTAAERVWRVLDVLNWTRAHFEERGLETPRLDAEVLLAHVIGTTRVMLYARHDQPLTPEERAEYRDLVQRRAAREPVAYLLAHREFWSLDFECRPGVLIPRPDTETLVEAALARLPANGAGPVADVGTGSGAVAVALAHERPNLNVWATDVSAEAVELARVNVDRHELTSRVTVVEGRGLAGTPVPLQMVVANLPYIPTSDIAGLMPDVRDHEPQSALDGGPDGLSIIRALAADARDRLQPDGFLLLEAGPNQVEGLAEELKTLGYRDCGWGSDLGERPRVVWGRAPSR